MKKAKVYQVFIGDTPYTISEDSVIELKERIRTNRPKPGYEWIEGPAGDYPQDGKYGIIVFPSDEAFLQELECSPLGIIHRQEQGPIEVRMPEELATQIDAIVLD